MTPSVEELLAAIHERLEAGEPVDWAAEVAAHPAHAEQLRRHAENLRAADRLLAPARPRGVGDRVGGYELVRYLGGGQGQVYAARDLARGRGVAVKLVGPAEERRIDRLEELTRLSDPRLVPILEVGTAAGRPFVVMPLVEGGDLRGRVAEYSAAGEHGPPATLAQRLDAIAELMAAVADGVAVLHRNGIIHRDVKPGNILLGPGGPVVCDFGLVRKAGAAVGDDSDGRCIGTWAYMAPEQAAGRVADTRSDVWALGAVLYELLTGHPPYCPDGVTLSALLRVKEHEALPPRPSAENPLLPPDSDLEWVCLRCLHRDPDGRLQSAADLAAKLRACARRERVRDDETWRQWLARVLPWPPTDRRPPAGEWRYPERWKNCLRIEAVTSFAAHAGIFSLAAAGTPGWVVWALFLIGGSVGWVLWAPARRRLTLTPMERAVAHWWAGADIAVLVLFWAFCPVLGPADPHAVNQFYAASAVARGLVFWIEGCTWWGRLHYTAAGLFLAAAVIPFVDPYGPLVHAAVYSGWFLWFSFQRWDQPAARG